MSASLRSSRSVLSLLPFLRLLPLLALLAFSALPHPSHAYPPLPEGCVTKIADSDRDAMRAVFAALPNGLFFWSDGTDPNIVLEAKANISLCCVESRDRESCHLFCPIQCSADGRITRIDWEPSVAEAAHSNSYGEISPAIGDLAELAHLELSYCHLTGKLPDSVSRLQKLTKLVLPDNNFTGAIPPGLFRLPALRRVDLSNTGGKLSGSLPDGPGAYSPSLEVVGLSGNLISGSIPAELASLTALQVLDLSWNRLTGTIPPQLRALNATYISDRYNPFHPPLTGLQLAGNSLSGAVPATLSNLSVSCFLPGNPSLCGPPLPACNNSVPLSEGCVTKIADSDRDAMRAVYAALPDSLFFWSDGNDRNIVLEAGANISLCCVDSLHWDTSCHLFCPIECSADGRITRIRWNPDHEEAGYRSSSFGVISPAIGDLAELAHLELSYCHLTGKLPDSVTRLQKLTELVLPDNNFTGAIPPDLFRLPALRRLDLSNTGGKLSGSLPDGEGAYSPSLERVALSGNLISGSIPAELASANALQALDLSWNNLTGTIPSQLRALTAAHYTDPNSRWLTGLQLAGNSLSGAVPATLSNLSVSCFLPGNPSLCGPPLPACKNPVPLPEGCVATIADSDRDAMRAVYAALPDWLFWWSDGNDAERNVIFAEKDNISLCCIESRDRRACDLLCPIECSADGRITRIDWEPSVAEAAHSNSFGAISPAIGDLAELAHLELSYCHLTGKLPDSVTRLQKLTEIVLPDNNFTGAIPPGLFRLPALRHVDLSNTGGKLSGSLPDGPGAYSPSLEVVGLSGNLISGSIPAELAPLKALQVLDLSWNNLTGTIPPQLRALTGARYADPNHRTLTGLQLAGNSLSGAVPATLSKLSVSCFRPGNPSLCGPPLPACKNATKKPPKKKPRKPRRGGWFGRV